MEEFKQFIGCFDDIQLADYCIALNNVFKNRQDNFAELCKVVGNIFYYCSQNKYKAKLDDNYNAYILLSRFGFKRKTVSNIVLIYDNFIKLENEFPKIDSLFFPFGYSKLILLCRCPKLKLIEDLNLGLLNPDMSVKEIKEYVKNINGVPLEDDSSTGNKEAVNPDGCIRDDEDSEFFNPNKHYERDFFENCNTEQLISICLVYQFELEKYTKEK